MVIANQIPKVLVLSYSKAHRLNQLLPGTVEMEGLMGALVLDCQKMMEIILLQKQILCRGKLNNIARPLAKAGISFVCTRNEACILNVEFVVWMYTLVTVINDIPFLILENKRDFS